MTLMRGRTMRRTWTSPTRTCRARTSTAGSEPPPVRLGPFAGGQRLFLVRRGDRRGLDDFHAHLFCCRTGAGEVAVCGFAADAFQLALQACFKGWLVRDDRLAGVLVLRGGCSGNGAGCGLRWRRARGGGG